MYFFRDSIRSVEWEKYRVHIEFLYAMRIINKIFFFFFFFISRSNVHLYDVGNSQRPRVSSSSIISTVLSAKLFLGVMLKDRLQSNPVASTPKAPSKRNTVCLVFSLSNYSSNSIHSIFCIFLWHYLALLCPRRKLSRHHAELSRYYQTFYCKSRLHSVLY